MSEIQLAAHEIANVIETSPRIVIENPEMAVVVALEMIRDRDGEDDGHLYAFVNEFGSRLFDLIDIYRMTE